MQAGQGRPMGALNGAGVMDLPQAARSGAPPIGTTSLSYTSWVRPAPNCSVTEVV
jgi:hypothetical protein